jgi:ferredoxin-thioredoxin reductase catalytic subunit
MNVENVKKKIERDAEDHGYYLNVDQEFLKDLILGLKENGNRYGYMSCPCRLASGMLEFDRDIICPCDYRDQDVEEYGHCYCALFTNKAVYDGTAQIKPIPERRPLAKQTRVNLQQNVDSSSKQTEKQSIKLKTKSEIQYKLFFCKQCGYVCFREEPPYICPICKAKKRCLLK